MTRDQAIEIRQKQLQGQSISPELVEEAIAVLMMARPPKKDPPERKPRVGPTRAYGGTARERIRSDNKLVQLLRIELGDRK